MSRVITGPTLVPHAGDDAAAGTLLRHVALPVSDLTSTSYAPRVRLSPHAHTSGFLLFVRDGGFVEQYGTRRERYDGLTCIYRPPLDEHANEFEERGAVLAAIDVGAEWLERLREGGFSGERFSMRSPLMQQFGDRLDAELTAPDSLSSMSIEALATEVIVFNARRGRKRERTCKGEWPERARRLIENEFASPLSLQSIASAVGVHRVHLARQFRALHGYTVGDYLRRVRVAYARQQLTKSEESIAEIALAAGFSDQSQLTKSFKRVTGETPAAYRARQR
ncbi:MAG TPA: AraC family transcriptional regulator [Thermoanaerobaculia bacterium]|nr:AraC family transcriptional regulator [Thermoanaerobaculia bacterium]